MASSAIAEAAFPLLHYVLQINFIPNHPPPAFHQENGAFVVKMSLIIFIISLKEDEELLEEVTIVIPNQP